MATELNLEDAVKYHYGKFPPSEIDYGKLIAQISKTAEAIGRYDQVIKSLKNSAIFLSPLRSQEAVISSRMEGTVSTMDEVLQYDANNDDSEARSETVETALYRYALNDAQIAINDGQPFSAFLIRSIHSVLLSFGRGATKSPGKFKTEQNYLAGGFGHRNVRFVPISPENLEEGIEKLLDFINNSPLPPLLKIAISHVEFEALHPFKDGNGRIGRMLITLLLWHYGLISQPHFYISAFFEDHRDEYIDSMREVSKSDDWTQWCLFFLKAAESQAKQNLATAERIQQLYEDLKVEFNTILSSKWNGSVLDFIFTYPIFPGSRLADEIGITPSTGARFIRSLVDSGILQVSKEPAGRRSGIYRFEKLMEIVRV